MMFPRRRTLLPESILVRQIRKYYKRHFGAVRSSCEATRDCLRIRLFGSFFTSFSVKFTTKVQSKVNAAFGRVLKSNLTLMVVNRCKHVFNFSSRRLRRPTKTFLEETKKSFYPIVH